MTDLFLGQTCSAEIQFISGGAAYDLTLPFDADKVVIYNLTDWTATAAGLPISIWWKNKTTTAHAYQQQVIDSAAGSSFNFLDTATNGFTVANTSGGVPAFRSLIAGVTAADPVVVTTTAAHGLQSNQIVRITDLGSTMPVVRGMDELNDNRYSITVINSTSFSLQDPVSLENIDGTGFTAWVAGGRINLESRVLTLNNPQVSPYSSSNPYQPNPFKYDPIEYILTLGTSIMGTDGDEMIAEVYKFGQVIQLNDIG